MLRSICFCALLVNATCSAQDWRQWRGPTGDHHAAPGSTAPTSWGEGQNLAWVTPLPGHGHSSPTLVGGRIYLTTADPAAETQSLLILDRASGEIIRETLTHQGGLPAEIHPSNTHASPTVASDGERVFALFHNQAAAWLTAYDLEGDQLWQVRVGGFDPQQYQFGFGSSPRVVGDLVIVATEYDGPESGIYAMDTATGESRWTAPRVKDLSYSSPAVATLAGRTQLLMSGNNQLASYDAGSGEELWSVEGSARATCGTMIWDEGLGLAFASGGYPNPFTLAVQTSGGHDIVWQNRIKCYEQSMLIKDGYIYAVADRGAAYCWRAEDGEEMWSERLGGKFSSSPVLVGDVVYATNEGGTTFVFRATPNAFDKLSENQLGDAAFATPTPADGRLYHRYFTRNGEAVQDYLTAIGE